jgi:hypothetical protein
VKHVDVRPKPLGVQIYGALPRYWPLASFTVGVLVALAFTVFFTTGFSTDAGYAYVLRERDESVVASSKPSLEHPAIGMRKNAAPTIERIRAESTV